MRVLGGLLFVVYLLVGILVARSRHYLGGLNSISAIISAILAVLLWPLLLLGVNLHIGKQIQGFVFRLAGMAA